MTAELVCVSPIDGSVVARRAYASEDGIARALERARAAQVRWRETPLAERARLCTHFVDACYIGKGYYRLQRFTSSSCGRGNRPGGIS